MFLGFTLLNPLFNAIFNIFLVTFLHRTETKTRKKTAENRHGEERAQKEFHKMLQNVRN